MKIRIPSCFLPIRQKHSFSGELSSICSFNDYPPGLIEMDGNHAFRFMPLLQSLPLL